MAGNKKIIIVGGGIAGCSAAVAASMSGAEVILCERTDMLGGCALFSGRIDSKYFTVREELRLMMGGCESIFEVFDQCKIHAQVEFPFPLEDVEKYGGVRKMLFDVCKLDANLQKYLKKHNVEIKLQARVNDVLMDKNAIKAIAYNGVVEESDVFIDATGGAGGIDNCTKYGTGCAMCLMRCPAFGNRVSIVEKAGVKELIGEKSDGSKGPISAAYSLIKESINPELKNKIEKEGMAIIPIPKNLIDYKRTEDITASAHLEKSFAENVVIVDTGGFAKRIAGGYQPLSEIRQIPGFENAQFADPMAGTIGNAVRYMGLSPMDRTLRVPGIDNLFIAGEKASICGLGEVVIAGTISGHNAARVAYNEAPLIIDDRTEIGDFINYTADNWNSEEALRFRYHLFTGPYWKRAYEKGLYTEDISLIKKRITDAGLLNVLSKRLQ